MALSDKSPEILTFNHVMQISAEIDCSGMRPAVSKGNGLDEIDDEVNLEKAVDLDGLDIDDELGLYFKDALTSPLLTAEEEINLAKRIELGLFAVDLLQSTEDELELAAEERGRLEYLINEGKESRDRLTRSNLRLVVSIAKKYRGRGLQFLDLIQEGNVGLMKAVEKFDYRRGNRFSTYATWWIRQAVTRALADHGRTIRIPVHKFELITDIAQAAKELAQKYGRQPIPEEIAEELDLPAERIRRFLIQTKIPTSLNSPVGDGEESELGDFIPDMDNDNAEVGVGRQLEFDLLYSKLKEILNLREYRIIFLRFGLGGDDGMSLQAVGDQFGLSRERIRQIEKEALRKLKKGLSKEFAESLLRESSS